MRILKFFLPGDIHPTIRLLERVKRGESITITKHGTPIARLVPIKQSGRQRTISEAIEELLEFRKHHKLDGLTIRELIDEGRR